MTSGLDLTNAKGLGLKSGRGFFEYDEQGRVTGAPPSPDR